MTADRRNDQRTSRKSGPSSWRSSLDQRLSEGWPGLSGDHQPGGTPCTSFNQQPAALHFSGFTWGAMQIMPREPVDGWTKTVAIGTVVLVAFAILGFFGFQLHHAHASSHPKSPPTSSSGSPSGPPPSSPNRAVALSGPRFLTSLPVASGDIPQRGLVNIGGRSFPHSLYYTNTVRIPPTYNTHFSLAGKWKTFVAWVGIQPDPTDPEGCGRDSGSTFEVLVDQTRVQEGEVPCGYTQKVSAKVAGAHDLNLVFNLNIVGATGDFAWADARLS